ncbi:hypothetical protein ACFU76_29490 [Streptomyces sp. NPDC057539]|uniref:hypothetical protein n=1 Tax=Streptomyces sp. NPDC057539 TaxID=3346159 RepID=UPI0036BAADD8
MAAGLLGAAPFEAVPLGDTCGDITAARAAGITPLGAGWGYAGTTALAAAWTTVVLDDAARIGPGPLDYAPCPPAVLTATTHLC